MDDLITRLEQATEGSRELSDEVLKACGWHHRVDKRLPDRSQWGWLAPALEGGKPRLILSDPSPTESIDVALTLVDFKGHFGWRISNWHEGKAGGGAWIDWCNDPVMSFADHHVSVPAATPALALCIAALKARK